MLCVEGYLPLPLGHVESFNGFFSDQFYRISVKGVWSFCSNGSALLNKMATIMPFLKKTLYIASGRKVYQVCSSDVPG